MFQVRFSIALIMIVAGVAAQAGDDWPMWRSNAGLSGASSNQLPDQLHLQWTRVFGQREQVWDDPLNHDLMPYDRVFEPVVKDGRIFMGFNDSDKVVALNLNDGRELWACYTDGPVRFPPVAWKDRVIFVSDDGCLYCVGAADGALIWKVSRRSVGQEGAGQQASHIRVARSRWRGCCGRHGVLCGQYLAVHGNVYLRD